MKRLRREKLKKQGKKSIKSIKAENLEFILSQICDARVRESRKTFPTVEDV
jgi:hypothetical protein